MGIPTEDIILFYGRSVRPLYQLIEPRRFENNTRLTRGWAGYLARFSFHMCGSLLGSFRRPLGVRANHFHTSIVYDGTSIPQTENPPARWKCALGPPPYIQPENIPLSFAFVDEKVLSAKPV